MSKELILIIAFVATVLVLELTHKRNLLKHMFVAIFFGCIWMLVSHSEYNYNTTVATIMGINLFSLFAWIMGLFASYLIYRLLRKVLRVNKWWKQFLLYTVIYIPMLIIAETVGYHTFGIVNMATATYSGLAVCNCLHAPLWMVASYISMGPIYFATCLLTGLESKTGTSPLLSAISGLRSRIVNFIYKV